MSAFETILNSSPEAYVGYQIGVALAERDEWMQRARDRKPSGEPRKLCVKYARLANRQLLKNLRHLREIRARA